MIPKKDAKTSIGEDKLLFYVTFFSFPNKEMEHIQRNVRKRTTGRINKKMLKVPGIDKTLVSLFTQLINPIVT